MVGLRQARKKGGWCKVTPVATPGQLVSRYDQQLIMTKEGDLLVTQGNLTLDVVDEQALLAHYDVKEEGQLVVGAAQKRMLEDRLGIGAAESGESLVKAVERLARISVGEIEITFTPGQLEEVQHRARKNNRSLTQELQTVVARLESELFHGNR